MRTVGPLTTTAVGFGLAIAFLMVFIVGSWRITAQLAESARWAAHAHKVSEAATDLHGFVQDAENATNAYLTDGDPRHLDRYRDADGEIRDYLDEFRELFRADPAGPARIDELAALIRQRAELLDRQIERRKTAGDGAVHPSVGEGETFGLTSRIHTLIDEEIAARERERLAQSVARAHDRASFASVAVVSGGLAGLAVVLAATYITLRGIQARDRAEAALLGSERSYRGLFENSHDAILLLDPDSGAVLEANPRACTLFGIPGATPTGGIAAVFGAASTGLADGETRRFVTTIRRADDAEISLEASVSVVEYQGRRAILCMSRDETERKRADEALRASEERFRLLVEGVRDYAIFALDPEGRVSSWNAGAERIKGYRADEVTGRHFSLFYPPDAVERGWPERKLETARETGWCQDEGWLVRKDGTRFWAHVVLTALRAPSGELIGYSKITRDLTERKAAEESLRTSEERFRLAAKATNDVIWDWDLGKDVIRYGDAIEVRFGYPPEEVSSDVSWWSDRIHPDDRDRTLDWLREAIEGGPEACEYRFLCRDGTYAHILDRCLVVRDAEGRPVRLVGSMVDLSDQKRVEANAWENERRFRAAFDHAAIGMALVATDGRWIKVNRAVCELLGRTEDELLATTFQAVTYPDDLNADLDQVRRMLTGEIQQYRMEKRYVRPDGEIVWALLSVSFVPNESGLPAYFVSQVQDVTERKRAEAALRASEEFSRLVIDSSRDCIKVLDLDGRLLDINQGGQKLLELRDISEILGCSWIDLWSGSDRDAAIEALKAARSGGIGRLQGPCPTHAGTPRWWDVLVTPIRGRDGGPTRLLAVSRDITERVRFDEAIRLRDRALEAFEQGVSIIDANLPDLPIVYVNRGFERLTGYSSEDVLNRNCRFLQGPDTDSEAIETIREAIRSGRPCQVELLNYRKDGTPFWNALSLAPVHDDAGRLTHYVGVQTDVSNRRLLEERFRQSQKMEAVGQLAGGIAHDFNNLLTVIIAYSDLMTDPSLGPDRIRLMADEVRKAGEKAAGLTGQLLAFSRKQILQPRVIDLNDLISGLGKLLGRLIGENVRIVTSLEPRLPKVRVDPGQMEQVVMNLALNARDAMPRGGRITIETGIVDVVEDESRRSEELKPGRYVLLSVADTGCGMDEATLRHIFEPFFTTKGPGKGTGLGLATVYGIVNQSEGHIAVESVPDRGTVFTIHLPAVVEPVSVEPKPLRAPAPGGTETILIVEDESAVRSLVRTTLKMGGYTVLEAGNGEDALRASDEYPDAVHLLVTDVVMPGMGGRDLAWRLARRRPDTAVLYTSGYTDDAIVLHGVSEEESEFLQKPFSPDALLRKVRTILDKTRVRG